MRETNNKEIDFKMEIEIFVYELNKQQMGVSCDYCQHRCCINGESGVIVVLECECCGKYMQLCSNEEMTDKELEERCNGEACGCADRIERVLCEDCLKEN